MIESEEVKNVNTIIIKVRNENYLLQVKNVKEIFIPKENIVPVPLADKSILGLIDIRGEIYTIISLRHKLYEKVTDYELTEKSRIVLLEMGNLKIALLIDEVIGVKKLPLSIFETKSTIIETYIDYRFIKSVGVLDDTTYILLDLDAIVPPSLRTMAPKPVSLPNKKEVNQGEFKQIPQEEDFIPRIPHPEPKPLAFKRGSNATEVDLKLTEYQKDTLKEIGNIGSGNAITALSRLIKKKIDVDLTDVGIITFEQLSNQFGGIQEKICGIFSKIKGPSESTILQVFEVRPLMKLVASLAGKDTKVDPSKVNGKEDLDDFAISTIEEMGNIMAGHYVSALADLTKMKMMLEKPEFALTNVGSLGEFLGSEINAIADFVVIIKTSIKVVDLRLNGVFFFIPDINTLYNFFDKLQIDYEPLIKGIKNDTVEKEIEVIELTELQRDALQEVGNMGAGNAANALAKMINKRVDINIPSVEMVELDKYANEISKKNEKLFIAWSNVIGKTRATVLSIFKIKDFIDLTSIIIDDKDKKKIDMRKKIEAVKDIPEIYEDAMKELGHILASHYANAIGDLLNLRLMTEPPDISVDTGKQLFKILQKEIGLLKKLSLVITTNVLITDIKMVGTFLFIPDLSTLKDLLLALEQFYE